MPDDVVDQLLELARWTGSAANSQPWGFVVMRDRDVLRKLAGMRPPVGWAAAAPVAIALVLDGAMPMFDAYDEGRVTERLLTGATLLGYGGGVAWFGDPQREKRNASSGSPHRSPRASSWRSAGRSPARRGRREGRGRKPLRELVSYERYSKRRTE